MAKSQRALRLLMFALLGWGVLLAIGSIGWQLQVVDPRRALFVMACVLAYCGLWLMTWRQAGRGRETDQPSWSGGISLVSGLAGWLTWAVAAQVWPVARRPAWILGALAAMALGASAVAGIIALSDPARRRGKWMAGVGGLLVLAAMIVFVWRAQHSGYASG